MKSKIFFGGDIITDNIQPHIQCDNSLEAKYALLPGDPGRVERVAGHLENVKNIAHNREYKTITGEYCGVKIAVTSTGIGGPSLAIALEELKNIGVSYFIRIGSAGSLQTDIKVGDMLIPYAAVRNDGTGDMYIKKDFPAAAHPKIYSVLVQVAVDEGYPFHQGISRSHDSFYIDDEDEVSQYWSKRGVIGADMETAPLMTLAALRGVKAASVLNVVNPYGGALDESINEYVDLNKETEQGERRIVLTALKAISRIDHRK
ncbi:MAG: nucleoside phosphorylase [Halanaerobiaceae bacterium]